MSIFGISVIVFICIAIISVTTWKILENIQSEKLREQLDLKTTKNRD